MKKTALYDIHKNNKAKMVEFAGWEMPVVYSSLKKEHNAVRQNAGLFDVSHMGEIEVTGPQALDFCQHVTTNNVRSLDDYRAQYTIVCNEEGGVLDDVIIYKISDNRLFFCINASNIDKIDKWFKKQSSEFDAEVSNVSDRYSQIAIQGPKSGDILESVIGEEIRSIRRFRFAFLEWNGTEVMIARTGYTGEDGYEVFLPWEKGPELWESLLEKGKAHGLVSCGLGARDTLRIEATLPLYGHEISEEINPLEAGLDKYIKFDSDDFIGKKTLENMRESGLKRKLVGFEMTDRGIPRSEYKIHSNGDEIGFVTSGTMSPTLNKPIGLGLVNAVAELNGGIYVEIRGKKRKAKIVEIPFYNK